MVPVTFRNDNKSLSEARNELRRQFFFHKEYQSMFFDPATRIINEKVYVPNSYEPDFSQSPDIEPSLNHFLLS
jgi:hypothetical protein